MHLYGKEKTVCFSVRIFYVGITLAMVQRGLAEYCQALCIFNLNVFGSINRWKKRCEVFLVVAFFLFLFFLSRVTM